VQILPCAVIVDPYGLLPQMPSGSAVALKTDTDLSALLRSMAWSMAASVCTLLPLIGHAQPLQAWPDRYETRVEILALMQTLSADLLASRSATQTLENWCREHRMADRPQIVARVLPAVAKAPTAEQLRLLEVSDGREIKYRRVELRCGQHLLSEADNWYVPSRLTAAINAQLLSSGMPFGKAVQPLQPYRRTVSVTTRWSPLPVGWEQLPPMKPQASSGSVLEIPNVLFEHHALLYRRDHRPFSLVHERYQREILNFSRSR
jgi:chorismate-pyruvate lyase